MKRIRNLFFVLFFMASAAITVIGQDQELPGMGGDGDIVKCYCTTWGKCKSSGGGNLCAQSQGGGNVNCQDYNGNC